MFEYVKEAHAHDEWPISSGRFNHGNGPVRVDQPTTNTHRLTLARRFQNEHDPNRDAFDVALARTISNEATSSSWSSRPGRFGSSASGAGTAIAAKRKQNAWSSCRIQKTRPTTWSRFGTGFSVWKTLRAKRVSE